MTKPPWPPQPGYTYRFRYRTNWHEAKLDRVDAQDPACVLYTFGSISVQLEMIEKPNGA
jgi:hypothetical protein